MQLIVYIWVTAEQKFVVLRKKFNNFYSDRFKNK